MPMSAWLDTDVAIKHIRLMKPKTVLDIGVGFGKWGYLIRGSIETEQGRMGQDDWTIILDGVEGCQEYIDLWSPMLTLLYDRIINLDIRSFLFKVPYDMIIAGDVLEHLTLEESMETITEILNHCRSFIFVVPTGPGWKNSNAKHVAQYPYEEHKCEWDPKSLERVIKRAGFNVQQHTSYINGKTITTCLGSKR